MEFQNCLHINKYMVFPGNTSYPCPACNKVYKYPESLHNHRKYKCGKKPMFECQYCHKKMFWKMSFKCHEFSCKNKKKQ